MWVMDRTGKVGSILGLSFGHVEKLTAPHLLLDILASSDIIDVL